MKTLLRIAGLSICAVALQAQQPPRLAVAPPEQIQSALTQTLAGEWIGRLEYPANPDDSAPRLVTPTWLTVTPGDTGLSYHFLYDDGHARPVEESLTIQLDVRAATYTITNSRGRAELYRVEGYSSLHSGLGDLIITGPAVDSHRPAATRFILTIRRNLFTWAEENRATPQSPYRFRHRYVFTRANPPNPSPKVGSHNSSTDSDLWQVSGNGSRTIHLSPQDDLDKRIR